MNKNEEKQVPDSSNSENNLKGKPRARGRKRKREDSESSSDIEDDLPENTLETEKNLQALAIKNNLDDVSVKKILKKVVTNDHVLALVKMREEEENSGTENGLRPKLTRAKAKELRNVTRGTAWHDLQLTPIKHIPVKTTPEVTALIAQELPDDEDDEEYEPTNDESDDDVTCSDLDSQPRTPATPVSQKKQSPVVVKDGPFKVPQEVSVTVRKKLDLEEEATIALRTRSKLSLSETPIEHIESSFIPPDDLPMPDVDDLWNEFLNECLNPESKANEEDDELDPEYNVAADPDANEEDEEALDKSIIRISKKELNDLVNELMTVMPDGLENQLISNVQDDPNQGNNGIIDTGGVKTRISGRTNKADVAQSQWEGKQEPISDDESQTTNEAAKITFESSNTINRMSVGKTEIEDDDEHVPERDSTQETVTADYTKVPKTEVPTTNTSDVPTIAVPRSITISVEERELPVVEAAQLPLLPPPPLLQLVAPPPLTVNIEVDNTVQLSPQQVSILEQQLRLHIQLAASNFLQLFVHPVHWHLGPQYKGYLETFNKIASENPKSVVNVCNLTPAVELVHSWESSVSEDTEENKKMVEFVQEEVEKGRRRSAGNGLYTGDFPEMFKKVVANSTVFLYPYILPPVPYRAFHTTRRFSYLKSEDSLIVLGLDQFWWYVENNPDIFKVPQAIHPRRRWGLMTTVSLICKHMLPWLVPKALLGHIQSVKKTNDKSNPIVKYFVDKTIDPVRHTILPFNPKLTLYEHPEIEMPKIWIKYLSISSKRFKIFNRRLNPVKTPQGIEVQSDKPIEPIQKEALPIDFIKPISCNRINIIPKTTQTLVDKIDVHITTTTSENVPNTNFLVAANLYTLINTSTGTKLMPLNVFPTSTVNSSTTPICSTTARNINAESDKASDRVSAKFFEISTKQNCFVIAPGNALKEVEQLEHCPCCIHLRRICKIRQPRITEYFKPNRENHRVCECTSKKYPRITNKLKLLVNNYKTRSNMLYTGLLAKLKDTYVTNIMKDESSNFSFEDFASAISYQTKLLVRTGVIRNNTVKNAVHTAFSKFNVEYGQPVDLAVKLCKIFNVDLADMYKEFLGFLTAEQAAALGEFKEYFIGNCVEDLIKKVEELVQDSVKRREILQQIKELFVCKSFSPCDICCELLMNMGDQPELARHVFSLFPHRRKDDPETSSLLPSAPKKSKTPAERQREYRLRQKHKILNDVEQENRRENLKRKNQNQKKIRDQKRIINKNKNIDKPSKKSRADYQREYRLRKKNINVDLNSDLAEVIPSQEAGSSRAMEQPASNKEAISTSRTITSIRKEADAVSRIASTCEGTRSGCEESAVTMDYEADNSSSDEELQLAVDEDKEPSTENNNSDEVISERREENVDQRVQLVTTINYEPIETSELTVTKTEVQENSETDMSIHIMSEDESIKTEPLEWTREDDKIILEILKQYSTPEERSDKTIIEIIKEKNLLSIITSTLSHKSLEDVIERVSYLLQILILSDYDGGKC